MKGSSEAKKAKGSLVAIAFGAPEPKSSPRSTPKGGSVAEYDEPSGPDLQGDAHSAAFDAFANAAGIPAAQRAKAQEALKRFVYACMSGGEADDD